MSADDTEQFDVAGWVDSNVSRAQDIADRVPIGTPGSSPYELGILLALLAIVGMMRLSRSEPDAAAIDWERLARESEPATGPGVGVRKQCGCLVDWMADSASPAYREAMTRKWTDLGGMTFEAMDHDYAAPLLVDGRECRHE